MSHKALRSISGHVSTTASQTELALGCEKSDILHAYVLVRVDIAMSAGLTGKFSVQNLTSVEKI